MLNRQINRSNYDESRNLPFSKEIEHEKEILAYLEITTKKVNTYSVYLFII
jgi:hypothetical protein